MSTMSLKEIRRRLEEIPAEEFGCEHEDCAIGQLHYIMTGKKSHNYYGNVYPFDVTWIVANWNDNLPPESRKALAMMLPLPKAFPELTPAHALKLAAWAGDQALSHYDGTHREVLENAMVLARRAAAGEPYAVPEATAVSKAVAEIRFFAEGTKFWVTNTIMNTAKTLLRVKQFSLWGAPADWALWSSANVTRLVEAEWRPWLEDYLRLRMDNPAEER